MSEGNAVQSEQMVYRVTKRSEGSEATGEKVFRELERLGVSATIIDCLWKAQEKRVKLQGEITVRETSEVQNPDDER